MAAAPIPKNEAQRLDALKRYQVLDTLPEESFDRLTRIASTVIGVPIALVSLIDSNRQWFKSACGLDATETSRDIAFCAYAILDYEPFIVENALEDPRFQDNPLVQGPPNIRFYAGVPLRTPDNFLIGTLCVIDSEPRQLSPEHIKLLKDLSCIVIDEMELRMQKRAVEDAAQLANKANLAKSQFLSNMSHELRTPLNAILGFAQLLQMDTHLDSDNQESVNEIHKAGTHLLTIINEILDLSRIEAGKVKLDIGPVEVTRLFDEIGPLVQPLANQFEVNVDFSNSPPTHASVKADQLRLKQVLINIVSNAIKYSGDGDKVTITQDLDNSKQLLRISVSDKGPGIPSTQMDKLFEPFNRLGAEKTNIQGSGIGLAITKQLVELMDGHIGVDSEVGVGTTFWVEFSISH